MNLAVRTWVSIGAVWALICGFTPSEFLPDIEGGDCANHHPPLDIANQFTSLNAPLPGDPGGDLAPRFCGSAPQEGDPVAIAHAAVFRHETDLTLPANGQLFFGVRRTYWEDNSDQTMGPGIPIGQNWHLSLDVMLFDMGDDLVLRDELGRLRFFHPDTDYSTGDVLHYSQLDQGNYAYALRNGTTSCDVVFNGGMTYRFTSGSGRLERITDRNGNQLTFTYDSSGRLTAVGNSADSRQIQLEYRTSGTGAGCLWRISDPQGIAATYQYASQSNPFVPGSPYTVLSSVSLRGGEVQSYLYTTLWSATGQTDQLQRLRMDRVLNASGQVLADYEYQGDTQFNNYLRPEIRGASNAMLVDYISGFQGLYGQVYNVAEPGGVVQRTYVENCARDLLSMEENGEIRYQINYLGCGSTPGSQPNQRLVASSTDHVAGETWTFTYDLRPNSSPPTYTGYSTPSDHFRQGNLLRIDYSSGGHETFTYGGGALNFVTSRRDRLGATTIYTHDSHGNLTHIWWPDGSYTRHWYDQFGNHLGEETGEEH